MKNTELKFFIDTTVAISAITGRNKVPILAVAVQESAILVTEDNALKNDAKKYLECVNPSEALKRLSI